jgi:hypothetical protein
MVLIILVFCTLSIKQKPGTTTTNSSALQWSCIKRKTSNFFWSSLRKISSICKRKYVLHTISLPESNFQTDGHSSPQNWLVCLQPSSPLDQKVQEELHNKLGLHHNMWGSLCAQNLWKQYRICLIPFSFSWILGSLLSKDCKFRSSMCKQHFHTTCKQYNM